MYAHTCMHTHTYISELVIDKSAHVRFNPIQVWNRSTSLKRSKRPNRLNMSKSVIDEPGHVRFNAIQNRTGQPIKNGLTDPTSQTTNLLCRLVQLPGRLS